MLGWGRQILEKSRWTIGITEVTVSAFQWKVINLKHDQFEINAAEFLDLRAFADGWGYYYPSPFQGFFSKTLYRRGLHTRIILRQFKVIKGKLLLQTYHTGKHFTGLLFSEPNAFQLFVFFICPILPKLEIEENNTSTNGQTKKRKCFLVSGLLQFSMWHRQLTPTNATLFGWTKSFLFRLRFGSFVLF